jgi:hypothetical protein
MAPNVNVVMYDSSARYEDDLEFVRRQLDDLALIRVMGEFRPQDDLRYQSLCQKEQSLLSQSRTVAVVS